MIMDGQIKHSHVRQICEPLKPTHVRGTTEILSSRLTSRHQYTDPSNYHQSII